ncbi:hypothetical protein [Enterobacter kobei]|uniref:hypothetical protein n=1 Tax=Enterobacter kobei TaxID=208224 RepID=UPI003891195B
METFFGCNAGEHEAAHVISEYCRADDSSGVPMWGQHGDFIIESFSGMRARVKVEAGCMMGYLSTSFHAAVDLGAPFVSETGIVRIFVRLSEVRPGETVVYVSRVFQNLIDARKRNLLLSLLIPVTGWHLALPD